ncbi:TadE/TadG family type IV pilus assembly protein [Comamonas serinivorans]|nr:TadE/TadG family type IV pilus assembly protein [Comamonas serinivorans]
MITPRPPQRAQRGLAAIEFALIAIVMVVMLLGGLVYWRAFQAQQSLTRAAGDGARAAHTLIAAGITHCHPTPTTAAANKAAIQQRVTQTVSRSLQQSAMPGDVLQQLTVGALQWGSCPSGGESSARFELTYTLTPLLGGNCSNAWFSEPCTLHEASELHFATLL